MTITKKQANKMRGKLSALLEVTMEYASIGCHSPEDALYLAEDYDRLKREFLEEIKNITEPSK